jgi:hypothetical protein
MSSKTLLQHRYNADARLDLLNKILLSGRAAAVGGMCERDLCTNDLEVSRAKDLSM